MFTSPQPVVDDAREAGGGLPADATIDRMPVAGGVFEIATVPLPATAATEHEAVTADLVGRAVAWASAVADPTDAPVMLPLYGTQVVWSARRAVAIAPTDRLEAMRGAIVEFTRREATLRDVERRIAAALEHLDDDAALAFEVDEQSLPRKRELAGRFREAIAVRHRLAVLAPAIRRPAPQPPTLAGQLVERLLDRTRGLERLEHAADQADLLDRVYGGCADRVAEYVTSRRHASLEWILILLLVAEVVLLAVDLLAQRAP